MMEQIIKILQKALNWGDLERTAAKLGLKIQFWQAVKNIFMTAIPIGGEQLYNYVNNNLQEFIHTDAKIIAKKFENGPAWQWKTNFSGEIFGQKFNVNIDPDYAAGQQQAKLFLYAGVGLLLYFMLRK